MPKRNEKNTKPSVNKGIATSKRERQRVLAAVTAKISDVQLRRNVRSMFSRWSSSRQYDDEAEQIERALLGAAKESGQVRSALFTFVEIPDYEDFLYSYGCHDLAMTTVAQLVLGEPFVSERLVRRAIPAYVRGILMHPPRTLFSMVGHDLPDLRSNYPKEVMACLFDEVCEDPSANLWKVIDAPTSQEREILLHWLESDEPAARAAAAELLTDR